MITVLASWEAAKNILTLILAFVFVLVLAYYGARFTAKYQGNMLSNRANIRITESFRVGGNKIIAIAKIGKSYYALGIGKDEINLIAKLDEAELIDFDNSNDSSNNSKLDFKSILANIKNKEESKLEQDTQDVFFEESKDNIIK